MTEPRRASEELLIQLVREGRHDAEIAVRLGITTGEVRERKAQLRGRLGEDRYLAATAAPGTRIRRRPPRWVAWFTGGVAALALLLVVASWCAPGEGTETPARANAPAATVMTLVAATVASQDGQPFEDLGVVFALGGSQKQGDVGQAENRLGLAVLRFDSTAFLVSNPYVEFNNGSLAGPARFEVRARLADRTLALSIATDNSGTILRALPQSAGPVLEVSGVGQGRNGTILVVAFSLPDRRQYQARLTNQGRLLVAREPIPQSAVVETFSGAGIDVSRANALGLAPAPSTRTVVCEPAVASALHCEAFFSGSLRAPQAGTVTCLDDGSLRFVSASGVGIDLVPVPPSPCVPKQVQPGDVLTTSSGRWRLVGRDDRGAQVSVAFALDGTLYVGPMRGTVKCPCLQGN